jgi:hypothetical protein
MLTLTYLKNNKKSRRPLRNKDKKLSDFNVMKEFFLSVAGYSVVFYMIF